MGLPAVLSNSIYSLLLMRHKTSICASTLVLLYTWHLFNSLLFILSYLILQLFAKKLAMWLKQEFWPRTFWLAVVATAGASKDLAPFYCTVTHMSAKMFVTDLCQPMLALALAVAKWWNVLVPLIKACPQHQWARTNREGRGLSLRNEIWVTLCMLYYKNDWIFFDILIECLSN